MTWVKSLRSLAYSLPGTPWRSQGQALSESWTAEAWSLCLDSCLFMPLSGHDLTKAQSFCGGPVLQQCMCVHKETKVFSYIWRGTNGNVQASNSRNFRPEALAADTIDARRDACAVCRARPCAWPLPTWHAVGRSTRMDRGRRIPEIHSMPASQFSFVKISAFVRLVRPCQPICLVAKLDAAFAAGPDRMVKALDHDLLQPAMNAGLTTPTRLG